jgi:ABC-type molybdenum transport system ATPase subunit/photorepair protein PhrA
MSHPAPHRTPSLDPALVVHGLTVRGDALPRASAGPVLLDRVDWRVERGEHWVVVGPNGAGKRAPRPGAPGQVGELASARTRSMWRPVTSLVVRRNSITASSCSLVNRLASTVSQSCFSGPQSFPAAA